MPHLVAFKRSWSIGSDDSAIVAGCFLAVRVAWLCVFSILVGVVDIANRPHFHTNHGNPCKKVSLLKAYVSLEIVLVLLTIFLLMAILVLSFRGSMMQMHRRRRVVPLWIITIILMILDCLWATVGSVWTFGFGLRRECADALESHKRIISLLVVAVVGQWFTIAVLFTLLYCIYSRVGNVYGLSAERRRGADNRRRMSLYRQTSDKWTKTWERRCQLLSCRCFRCSDKKSLENNFAFAEISQLLVRYFGDYDLVPTDIAAGLILLRRTYATAKRKIQSKSGITVSALGCSFQRLPTPLHGTLENDEIALQDLSYYSKYMAAAYGWSMFQQMNPMCSWLCKAAVNRNCGFKCCSGYEWNIQDTCCQCNLAAVTEIIDKDDDAEVLYSNWNSQVFQTPFYVAADHKRRKIIISVRGTRSFTDALTDLCADYVRIHVIGVDNAKVHKGMYQAASYVKMTMASNNVLERAKEKYPGYQLVTVGHSLGAGVASLLALQFRETHSNTKCYAFCPPGALMNLELAKFSRNFILTCVVGLDVVPRLSLATMEDLKENLVRMIAASKTPKWSIICRSCPGACCGAYYACGCHCCCPGEEVVSDEILYSPETEENIVKLRSAFYHLQRQECQRMAKERMYLPGRIIHLLHLGRGFRAAWTRTEDFQKIAISPKMVSDHLVHNVTKAIKSSISHLEQQKIESGKNESGWQRGKRRKSYRFHRNLKSTLSNNSEAAGNEISRPPLKLKGIVKEEEETDDALAFHVKTHSQKRALDKSRGRPLPVYESSV